MDKTLSWPVFPQSDAGSGTPSVDEPDARLFKRAAQR
jgi:hypothetical protein